MPSVDRAVTWYVYVPAGVYGFPVLPGPPPQPVKSQAPASAAPPTSIDRARGIGLRRRTAQKRRLAREAPRGVARLAESPLTVVIWAVSAAGALSEPIPSIRRLQLALGAGDTAVHVSATGPVKPPCGVSSRGKLAAPPLVTLA